MMDHLTLTERCDLCGGSGRTLHADGRRPIRDCHKCYGTGRMTTRKEVTVHICGVKCDHDWNGPWAVLDNAQSATCSKCGALAINVSMMEGM